MTAVAVEPVLAVRAGAAPGDRPGDPADGDSAGCSGSNWVAGAAADGGASSSDDASAASPSVSDGGSPFTLRSRKRLPTPPPPRCRRGRPRVHPRRDVTAAAVVRLATAAPSVAARPPPPPPCRGLAAEGACLPRRLLCVT